MGKPSSWLNQNSVHYVNQVAGSLLFKVLEVHREVIQTSEVPSIVGDHHLKGAW